MRPRVSIIIATWNGLPLLRRFLPTVVSSAYPNLEIIIADNASDDGSAAWVEATFPDVHVVRHPANWGYCRGNNAAIAHATGEYILLLNNDVEVPSNWLDPLVDALEQDERVAAVQPKLLQFHRRDHFEYAGGSGGFLDRFGYPFTRGRLFFTLEEDRGQYDEPINVFWATGAALLLRRKALEDVGYLDERFRMHMEEIDLCWRLWRHGWRVRVEPGSRVYHLGGGSLPQGDPVKTYYNFRNSLLMLYKNLPHAMWLRLLPLRAALDAAAAARAFRIGRPAESRAILRAYGDAVRLLPGYRDERPGPVDVSILPPYRGSIVFDYFIRGRRRFSELPSSHFSPLNG